MDKFKKLLSITLTIVGAISCVIVVDHSETTHDVKALQRAVGVEPKLDNKKYMTFDDWLQGKFEPKEFYPTWVSDSEYIYRNNEDAIMKKNISNDDETGLLSSSAWKSLINPSSFYASGDLQYVAITYQHKDAYVHYMRTFSVVFFRTNDSQQVFPLGFPHEGIQKIKWEPLGYKMAYVHDFDVFLLSNHSSSSIQVTDDGENNVIFNGITDWGYELEITKDDALVWWSPNGTYLAYVKLDQTGVRNFDFPYFGGSQYSTMVSLSYPKPGNVVPKTLILIVNVENPTVSIEVMPSDNVTCWGEYYLNSLIWKNDQIFMPTWKNRLQNEAISESCNLISNFWTCNHVSGDVIIGHNSWLGDYKPSDIYPILNTNEYLTVRKNSVGYLHLVLVDRTKNSLNWRTNGTFEVVHRTPAGAALHFYDKRNDYAYFTSTEVEGTEDGSPRIRHLWKVKAHGDRTRECVSCDLNTIYADRCNWVDPTFSPEGSYVVINCGGTGNGVPVSTLHYISDSGDISLRGEVENNTQLIENLEAFKFRTREYGEISLPQVDDEVFYYTLHKPPNFDSSKKYPLLVQVYSGPGYQDTIDSFISTWAIGYIPSSDLDVVVVTFDGRGTGFRGDKIRNMVYNRLGEYEPLDQIEATRQITEKYNFIDSSKIAMWGRSYGGYITARTMSEDENILFRCGLSVAPVTDWMTYHNFYTERYMGLPKENRIGYNKSTVFQKLHNIGKHYFVLIHGTSDENVHFLHSARLSKALIDEDIDFSAYFAGDEPHRFDRGANAYGHHYKLLTHHLKTCFEL